MGYKLKDKVAIITGAGTGIGKSIAIAYAREGANIVGAARRIEKLEETAKEIDNLGRTTLVIKCDVSKKEDCDNVALKTMDELGRIDILINNAAIYPMKPFLEITSAEWDEVLAVNLKGCMLMSQAMVPHMIKQKSGKIIMVNTGMIRESPHTYEMVHYTVSKMGILGLTRCLAAEFGPMGIQVNGFAPAYTPDTEGTAEYASLIMTPEHEKEALNRVPARRWGRVDDYNGIAVFLASSESDYINGQTISVDGGETMAA
ncbi:SDR family NAD(P)-dependent oxidoreductase [Chloroflexota bacterium]